MRPVLVEPCQLVIEALLLLVVGSAGAAPARLLRLALRPALRPLGDHRHPVIYTRTCCVVAASVIVRVIAHYALRPLLHRGDEAP
eukprot:1298061-Prymnesium_polylepis.1